MDGSLDAIWRIESPRLVASLARLVRDVGRAEDLAQDAFVAALEQWPMSGVPAKPGAWLMSVARRRAIDELRRGPMLDASHAAIAYDADAAQEAATGALDAILDDHVGDDLLRLILTACHPVLTPDAQQALTLRLVGGLTTSEIARAFLVPEATIGQRIVRAKRTLAEARVPFETPRGDALRERIAAALRVIYLLFNEGYSATAGDEWMRPSLCDDALRIGRVLATLVPDEPEIHGLVALLELQASRQAARVSATGEPILLLDQQRSRWDYLLIGRGLASLRRAEVLCAARGESLGPYALQASIAACHARVRHAGDTDWARVVALYDALAGIMPSPIVELNRAVAVSMAFGPAAALVLVDALQQEPRLSSYHLLPSVRGDLLAKLGRRDEARAELQRAASLTDNVREQRLLQARARELDHSS
ncbi:MAG: RNA polymerase sigma factor [Gemmatimonadota bacterium]